MILKKVVKSMRVGSQIWVSNDEVKCVNDIGIRDLLEKPVKKQKNNFKKTRFVGLYLLGPP